MDPTRFAQISNLTIPAATVVYALALLANVTVWALNRKVAPVTAAAATPALVGAGVGAVAAADGGRAEVPEPPVTTDTDERRAYRSDAFSRIGVALLILGFALHLVGVVTRGLAAGRVPWGNMYEFTIVSSLAAAGVYLIVLWKYRTTWLGVAVTALLTAALGLAVPLYVPAGPLVPALDSYWLVIHVAAVAIAGGGFTIGGLISILYLMRTRAEATAKKNDTVLPAWLQRVPKLEAMDAVAFRVHAFAFPLWTFGVLIAGPIWALHAWGKAWGWDPKEVWSLIIWLIYAGYLHARVTGGWWGKRAAIVALVGWAAFLFNFFGINLLVSGLHSYAGV